MAGSWFRESRNVELSCLDYLSTQIAASWSGISVIKSFKDATIANLPAVCVRLLSTDSTRKEIGTTSLMNTYNIVIDIFCKSDGQRIDLSDFILNQLKDGFVYNAFSHVSGDNSQVEKNADGRVHFIEVMENARVDFSDMEVSDENKYRHILSILVRKI